MVAEYLSVVMTLELLYVPNALLF